MRDPAEGSAPTHHPLPYAATAPACERGLRAKERHGTAPHTSQAYGTPAKPRRRSPASSSGDRTPEAWQLTTASGEHRLFVINKSDHPVSVTVPLQGARAEIDRMTPYDPDGSGRTLDAPHVRIDGRHVAADGTWPGFHPTAVRATGNRTALTLAAGEAAVVTSPGRP
jgi:hypothetical protein